MIKIQIKSIWGGILFKYEKENNTVRDTLIEAVRKGADLCGANLCDANLRGADLRGAEEIPYVPFACPSDGAFVGWKKVCGNLIKLEIPEGARRCSATSNKCRCDKAKVLSVWNMRLEEEVFEVVNRALSRYTSGRNVLQMLQRLC